MARKKAKHSKGYWLIYKPRHPYANAAGYIPEHRFIMESEIGRYINPLVEDVHHIDNGVVNNNLNNLKVLTKMEHRRIHNGWEKINGEWWKTCNRCKRFLKVKDNFYKRHSGHNAYVTFCKKCCGEISHNNHKERYEKSKDKIIICPICHKEKIVSHYAKTIYCSRECVWKMRKGGG